MSLSIQKYLKDLKLPQATGEREKDTRAWLTFENQVRAASLGGEALECFQVSVPQHNQVNGDEVSEQKLDVLGKGVTFMGDPDESNENALWVVKTSIATKRAILEVVEALSAGKKKKRNLVYYLLTLCTADHKHLYGGEPQEVVFLWAALKQKFDSMSPQATGYYIDRCQKVSIAHRRHIVPNMGTSFDLYCRNFDELYSAMVKRKEERSIISLTRTFLEGLDPVRQVLDVAIAHVEQNPDKFPEMSMMHDHFKVFMQRRVQNGDMFNLGNAGKKKTTAPKATQHVAGMQETGGGKADGTTKPECKHCGKPHEAEDCWTKCPHKKPTCVDCGKGGHRDKGFRHCKKNTWKKKKKSNNNDNKTPGSVAQMSEEQKGAERDKLQKELENLTGRLSKLFTMQECKKGDEEDGKCGHFPHCQNDTCPEDMSPCCDFCATEVMTNGGPAGLQLPCDGCAAGNGNHECNVTIEDLKATAKRATTLLRELKDEALKEKMRIAKVLSNAVTDHNKCCAHVKTSNQTSQIQSDLEEGTITCQAMDTIENIGWGSVSNLSGANASTEQQIANLQRQIKVKRHEAILDGGCTHHLFTKEHKFVNVKPHRTRMKVANKESIEVKEIGDVWIVDRRKVPILIRDVCKTESDMAKSYVSESQLSTKNGWDMHSKAERRWFEDSGGKVVLEAKLKGGLYVATDEEFIGSVDEIENAKIVHRRFGHVSVATLKKSAKAVKNLEIKGKSTKQVDCGICMRSHMNRSSAHSPGQSRQNIVLSCY